MTREAESLTAQAYNIIRTEIIVADFRPGEKLTINRLMEKFDLSRTPVREALVRLQDEGLVHAVPQSGTFVSRIDLHMAAAALYIRETVERRVTSELCEKATEEDITRLRAILRETDDAVANQDFVALYKADNGFHELTYAIAGHPEVFKWISDVTTPLDRFRYLRTITEELPWKRTQNEHRVIVNAIAAHDASKVVDSVMDHLDPMLNDREKIVSRFPQYFENA